MLKVKWVNQQAHEIISEEEVGLRVPQINIKQALNQFYIPVCLWNCRNKEEDTVIRLRC